MKRTNIKLMSDKDTKYFKDKYSIYLENNQIVVKINKYEKRKTRHSTEKSFVINSINFRVIRFTKDTIDIWLSLLKKNQKYDLIDVQNKVNELYMCYQPITEENVLKELEKTILK